jgi:hypothetical protein
VGTMQLRAIRPIVLLRDGAKENPQPNIFQWPQNWRLQPSAEQGAGLISSGCTYRPGFPGRRFPRAVDHLSLGASSDGLALATSRILDALFAGGQVHAFE